MSDITRKLSIIPTLLTCLLVLPTHARPEVDPAAEIKKWLHAVKPNLPIERVSASPVAGLYQVLLSDGGMLYATADGNHLVAGDMFRVGKSDLVNLAEEVRRDFRREVLEEVDPEDMIVFAPEGNKVTTIDVFTDVDCGFCRKLHRDIAALNGMGIEVRYLAYPRAGVGSQTYDRMVSAWCSEDPNSALTALKAGEDIGPRTCSNAVADELDIGSKVGVEGTPTIVTEEGELIVGYVSVQDLARRLGIESGSPGR